MGTNTLHTAIFDVRVEGAEEMFGNRPDAYAMVPSRSVLDGFDGIGEANVACTNVVRVALCLANGRYSTQNVWHVGSLVFFVSQWLRMGLC